MEREELRRRGELAHRGASGGGAGFLPPSRSKSSLVAGAPHQYKGLPSVQSALIRLRQRWVLDEQWPAVLSAADERGGMRRTAGGLYVAVDVLGRGYVSCVRHVYCVLLLRTQRRWRSPRDPLGPHCAHAGDIDIAHIKPSPEFSACRGSAPRTRICGNNRARRDTVVTCTTWLLHMLHLHPR